jgi:hypothetical protein
MGRFLTESNIDSFLNQLTFIGFLLYSLAATFSLALINIGLVLA